MQIHEDLESFVNDKKKRLILTIGFFDGVHRGHQTVLKRLIEQSKEEGHAVLLTFNNHPSTILNSEHPVPLICTLPHRIKLLEEAGVQTLFLIPFTRYISRQTAPLFIEKIRIALPFSTLILGYDASVGKNRQGGLSTMQQLAMIWGFDVEYVSEYRYEGNLLSSSSIRQLIQQGKLEEVENFLGRPYSIYSKIFPSDKKERPFKVLLDVRGLCLPPPGSYDATIRQENLSISGTAVISKNLSILNEEASLEIFSPTNDRLKDLSFVEVIFHGP